MSFLQIVLRERPKGHIEPTKTFESKSVQRSSLPDLKDGEALVKTTWLSLDPAMRGWLNDTRSYVPPVGIGEVMRAGGLGIVEKVGPKANLRVGDLVSGTLGWTQYVVLHEKKLEKITPVPGSEALDYLHALSFPGMTAYFGLKDVGKLKKGETLVVSGAAGAVGSLACQLGKQSGAKVIAIAGSDDKCEWLKSELGVDHALNYKSKSFYADWKALGYYDVYFDNVGGDMLDYALTRMNPGARIALCGAISQYNVATKPKGLQAYLNLISQRGTLQGFIVFDYVKQFPGAQKEIAEMLSNGTLKRKFHIVEGLENAPTALPLLYSGGNTGKLLVKVADDSNVKANL